jgi:hypothetical protein
MSSLDSQTIVPTLTRFGRVKECTLLDSKLGALLAVEVTVALCPDRWARIRRGGPGRTRVAIWRPGRPGPSGGGPTAATALDRHADTMRA